MLPQFNQDEVQTVSEHINGEVLTRYIHKGINCPVIDLTPGAIGKTCAGLQMIIKDLDLVEASITTAGSLLIKTFLGPTPNGFNIANSEHIILWSLYSSAIITYAKCFTAANERDVKLDVSDFNKIQSSPGLPTLKDLHNKIWRLRNDWIAHGGKNDLERGKTLALLDPSGPDKREPTVLFHSRYSAIPSAENLDDLLAVARSARSIAKHKLERGEINLRKTELSGKKLDLHIRSSSDFVRFRISY